MGNKIIKKRRQELPHSSIKFFATVNFSGSGNNINSVKTLHKTYNLGNKYKKGRYRGTFLEYLKNCKQDKKAVILIKKDLHVMEDNHKERIEELKQITTHLSNVFTYPLNDKPLYKEAAFLGNRLLTAAKKGGLSEISLAFTAYREEYNLKPTIIKIYPVKEPLTHLLPKYINSIIFGVLLEVYKEGRE